jgi:hypothetical protein
MARQYDDGSLSAQKSTQLLEIFKNRIATNVSTPGPNRLGEIASDFFQRISDHRKAVERRRIHSSARLPDTTGLPSDWKPLSYLKYTFSNLFKESLETSETLERQARAADALGEIVDRNIASTGGDLSEVEKAKAGYLIAKTVDDSVSALDARLRTFLSHVRVSLKICPEGKMEAALKQLDDVHQVLAQYPEIATTFPPLERSEITAPWGYMFERPGLERNLERHVDLIAEFQGGFNEFNVMSEHQKLWQQRSLASQASGLHEEARICSEVAQQYDAAYFRTLESAWTEKSVGTYAPKF